MSTIHRPTSTPGMVNMFRAPMYQIITAFFALYPSIRSLPNSIWSTTDMPKHPASIIAPLHLHTKSLATLVHQYDTCSPHIKDQLKWTICLQAALVNAYSIATHRQPGILLQSHQIRVDNEPSPFLIYVDEIILPWNHQDYFILNSFPPEFHPLPTPDLWDDFHQCITKRLKQDGFYQEPYFPGNQAQDPADPE